MKTYLLTVIQVIIIAGLCCIPLRAEEINTLKSLLREKGYEQIVSQYREYSGPDSMLVASAVIYSSLRVQDSKAFTRSYETISKDRKTRIFIKPFDRYMIMCIDSLDILAQREDLFLFLNMYINTHKERPRFIAKELIEMCEYYSRHYQSDFSTLCFEALLPYRKYIAPSTFYKVAGRIARDYGYVGNNQKAFRLFKECADYYKGIFGENNISYAEMLIDLSASSRFVGKDGFQYLKEAERIIIDSLKLEKTEQGARLLDDIGTMKMRKHEYDREALEYMLRSKEALEACGDTVENLAACFNNIGFWYYTNKEYDKSLDYYYKSLEVYRNPATLVNISSHFARMGDEVNSFKYLQMIDTCDLATSFSQNVIDYAIRVKNYPLMHKYCSNFLDYYRNLMQQNIISMSENDRGHYVRWMQSTTIERELEEASRINDDTLAAFCYDYLLLSKSLMLSFDSSIDDLVRHSQNPELKNLLFTIRYLRANSSLDETNNNNVDSLEYVLLQEVRKEGDFSQFLDISYREVGAHLKDNDIAIEFSEQESSNSIYAVLLERNTKPIVVYICNTDSLPNDEYKKGNYNYETLSSLIWKPILPHLKGKKNIFFSPMGHLYNLPIESLPLSDGAPISSHYNLHRLSSTRELARRSSQNDMGSNAVIYGGLRYDTSLDEIIKDNKRYSMTRSVYDMAMNMDSLQSRYQYLNYLPGTLEEANLILEIINKSPEMNAFAQTGKNGTEASFKALSGQRKKLIHIATHGTADNKSMEGDDAMDHCCLFFSGARNKISGMPIPENVEDGILTANEISSLDLRGLDLVTLSTCQSGLGDITSDGVWGLQRGFKKAGAKSILMTLWNIDDNVTCLLMTKFYRNLVKGDNKYTSLKKAQNYIRRYDNGRYKDPKYWAGFILLDAF